VSIGIVTIDIIINIKKTEINWFFHVIVCRHGSFPIEIRFVAAGVFDD